MEKRRRGFWFQVSAAALGAAAAALSFQAWPCTPLVDGTRVESARYVLAYKTQAVEVAKHFALEVSVCPKPGQPAPESLRVDAHMPEHRHGMNYAPAVKLVGAGRWRAEGLMFHMPGRWEIVFEVHAAGAIDRLSNALVLSGAVDFSKEEIARILQHGPWPPPRAPDPSNRVSGKPEAIALGEELFFEPSLSGSGSVLCSTCHAPYRYFQDARARAFGLATADRNTPTLVDARFYRWFGWDGAQDSLWSQSIRPLLDPKEMSATPAHVANTVRKLFAKEYERAFDRAVPADDEEVLVDAGKALAAFQETLVSGRTAFDDFRDSLWNGNSTNYPPAAQRGLKIFIGKGNCSVCHFGPRFTNGEFADTGVPFFVAPGRVDPGRHGGIEKLKASRFNLLGPYNDDASRTSALGTRLVKSEHRNFGEFRVPGLRGVARTAPYMHNGSLATLRDVAKFYSELNEERLHADGEKILKPLRLSDEELGDLLAFLESL